MTDHPTAAEIAGMARGTISRSGLQRMVAHLLEGCPRCVRQLASAIEVAAPAQAEACPGAACAGAAASGRATSSRRSPAHSSQSSRSSQSARSAQSPRSSQSVTPPAYDEAAYDPPIARACATALRHVRQLEHDRNLVRAAAPSPEGSAIAAEAAVPIPALPAAIAAALQRRDAPPPSPRAAPPATPEAPATPLATASGRAARQTAAADLGVAAQGKRRPHRGTPATPATPANAAGVASTGADRHPVAVLKVEMLLNAAWDLRHTDPQKMLQIAELALSAAERLEGTLYGEAAVADLRSRAAAELANAYRVCDDFFQAERMMAEAVRWQRRGSGDVALVVRIGDLLASLLVDQRRFPEADELLDQVQSYYQHTNDQHLTGRTLIKRGIFAGYDGSPRRALRYLTEGLERIDVQQDRRLAVQAVHSILWNLVECERYRQARIHLWRTRSLLLEHGGEIYPLLLRWLEGRIDAGLGELDRAERELAATRQGFADAGNIFNAALSSLDLAAVWLRQGKTLAVRQLVEEMIANFRALRLAREAVAALLILREACDRDEATLDRLQAVAALLTEMVHQQPRRPMEAPVAD